jgi:4-coumarate--CoA ligase
MDVKPGQRGEILVKGPVVTKGYHNNPAASKEAFVDGWFYTGDVAEMRNGLIYIVDRKKVGSITSPLAESIFTTL